MCAKQSVTLRSNDKELFSGEAVLKNKLMQSGSWDVKIVEGPGNTP